MRRQPLAADRLLRGEWGFDGTVVSDYFAINQLDEYHHVVGDLADGGRGRRCTPGIDVELPGTDCYGDPLRAAIDRGRARDGRRRRGGAAACSTPKFRLGSVRAPVRRRRTGRTSHTRTGAADRARPRRSPPTASCCSRNDGVLPAAPPPTSDGGDRPERGERARNLLGDYSYLAHVESLLEVLKSGRNVFAMPLDHGADVDDAGRPRRTSARCSTSCGARCPTADVVHAEGCAINDDDRSGFDDAVGRGRGSDVAVLVMGERSGLTDDCTTGESRDVASLDLPGRAGGARAGRRRHRHAGGARARRRPPDRLRAGPRRGQRRPDGVAAGRAGRGRRSPTCSPACAARAASCPISYPRSSGQIPVFYGHKVSGGRSHWKGAYVDLSNEPLYPFGHGLSYSAFSIDVEPLDAHRGCSGDTVLVAVTLTNIGSRPADETVQLYSRDHVATLTRPVRELQGFARTTLEPGASARLTFHIAVEALGYTGLDNRYGVEAGDIEILVGTSAVDTRSAGHVVITGPGWTPVTRPAASRVVVEQPVTT